MRGRVWCVAMLAAISAACVRTIVHNPPVRSQCVMSTSDQAWIDRALAAWRYSSRNTTGIGNVPNFQAVFFSADCILTSDNALSSNTARDVHWVATRHSGMVALPDGQQIPAGVISFAHSGEGSAFFVMAVPSVWRAGNVPGGALGLDTLMVAVLLHESSHVAQSPTYGKQMEVLAEANHLPESFNDDSIQNRFESNPEFTASVLEETYLLYEAATAADRATTAQLAQQARALMRVRAERFFTADDAYLREAEDIWLTFEGAGQWAGYQWVIDPRGGAMPVSKAMPDFARRSRWWSQNQGLALFLVLDRLVGPEWKRHAFHDGRQTVLQMLDAALAAP